MRVAEWFPEWVIRHQSVVRRGDWPAPEDRFWDAARKGLIQAGVTQDEADAASNRLALAPPRYLGDQIEALLTAVATARGEAARAERPTASSCPECAGGGLTSRNFRFMHRDREVVASLACYCPCRAGRWLKGQHDGNKDLAGRILDLATLPRTVNLCNPPEDWGHARVLDAVTATHDLASALAMR